MVFKRRKKIFNNLTGLMIPSPGFISVLVLSVLLSCPNFSYGQEWNIVDFGAVGDGATMNTKQIQKAVDRCHEKGGTVIVPPGKFLTGTLILRDNVSIRLMNRAVLKGSPEIKDYPVIMPDYRSYTDDYVKHSLIYAEKAENINLSDITIIAKGGGKSIDMEDVPENEDSYPDPDLFKSNLPSYGIYLRHVRNIRIDNVNLDVIGNDERPALVMDDVINGEVRNLNADGLSPVQQKILHRNTKELKIDGEEIND